MLYEVAHFVAEVANLAPDEHMAFVGKSAFAHKGGVHVAAMRRSEHSYQHVDPALVGNKMRVVVSELSGRGNLLSKAEEYGLGKWKARKWPQSSTRSRNSNRRDSRSKPPRPRWR